ncbi:MAG: hypothetical protein U0694_00275 [Anaerolineae bacterium]
MAEVAAAWVEVHQQPSDEIAIDQMYRKSVHVQQAVVTDYAALVPGTLSTIDDCRKRGLKIGSSTGYSQAIMDVLLPAAAAQGYSRTR